MIKIDKNKFIEDFLFGRKKVDNDKSTFPDLNDSVSEIQHNHNYYYSVDNSSESYQIQKNLLNFFLSQIELNSAATAFRKGFSYFNFLESHRFGVNFLRVDISSFFHSVRFEDLEKVFEPYFADDFLDGEKKYGLLDVFLSMVTYSVSDSSGNSFCKNRKILPIGFITSPAISNILFRSIDLQIQGFCNSKGISYSRYADDMLFSSESSLFIHSDSFYKEISILVSQLGFKLNSKKTIKQIGSISINGYVIKNTLPSGSLRYEDKDDVKIIRGIWISKKKTKIIEKLIYLIKVKKVSSHIIMRKVYGYKISSKFSDRPIKRELLEHYAHNQLLNKLTGYRSYLISVVSFNKKYNCISGAAELKYIKLINDLTFLIDKWTR